MLDILEPELDDIRNLLNYMNHYPGKSSLTFDMKVVDCNGDVLGLIRYDGNYYVFTVNNNGF